ncbi:hypothetical protein ACJEBK_19770 [Peribacillus frigoritolerans]|uniref:hypothetical protein n=1 Tax=Peribacillus frigoritolerans TaxID=450367 RepID=UPI00387268A8
MKKQKSIMKKSLAMHLLKKGHTLEDCVKNKNRNSYFVYKFIETPELIIDMLEFNANR